MLSGIIIFAEAVMIIEVTGPTFGVANDVGTQALLSHSLWIICYWSNISRRSETKKPRSAFDK